MRDRGKRASKTLVLQAILVEDGSALAERLFGIEDGGKLLVFHVDPSYRLSGCLTCFGRNSRDPVADEAHRSHASTGQSCSRRPNLTPLTSAPVSTA